MAMDMVLQTLFYTVSIKCFRFPGYLNNNLRIVQYTKLPRFAANYVTKFWKAANGIYNNTYFRSAIRKSTTESKYVCHW